VAHGSILLALAALWAMPHAQLTAVANRSRVAPASTTTATKSPETTAPLQQMAARARVSTTLPNAGNAFFMVPPAARTPVTRAASKTSAKPAAVTVIAPAPAVYVAPASGWGNDVSWPQCGGSLPGPHDVGVIGVTDGRPFTTNPCLASEYAWARASKMAGGAQLYLNLEIGGSSDGPHKCAADDHQCRAYDYGWLSVTDAMSRASGQGVSSTFWWLDVEIGNRWSDNVDINQPTVQGAIDAVHSRNLDVGIYSSADQWALIVPDAYQPGVPTWLAVVGDQTIAPRLCARKFSLTGGPVYMVQYDDHVFDWDHVCASGSAGFAAAAARHGH
jgi:hypothetical protein